MEPLYECPFCGNTKTSPNGTGTDVSCCGEVGHAITVLHVIGPMGEAKCSECGSLHEDEGGDVYRAGSWDEGPFYWACGNCRHQWGFA